jgi:hypothetical protein
MSFSYDPTLSSDLDKVRLYLGDTTESSPLYTDEEITALLEIENGALLTAASLADSLAAKYSRSVSFSVEGLSISNSTKTENYRTLAQRLRAQAGDSVGSLGTPILGGISYSTMDGVEMDADRVRSRARIGMTDFVGPRPELGDQ